MAQALAGNLRVLTGNKAKAGSEFSAVSLTHVHGG
jgi:hypothetical protein